MKQDRKRCLKVGMNDHIAKPFDPDQDLLEQDQTLLAAGLGSFKLKGSRIRMTPALTRH